ncbi:MAG TPA: low molecular weight protein arginine phosphatase [Candidatus Atribacteria bacterium]|nr:MAG: Protein tyrosine phosphatase [Atribacteria bacterium 34_128]HAJ32158.1 low molecular weight protein arginine phosphatase [Candidatus Atribacteria bacterium]
MIKTILFVCTGNTCRSTMAEGIFKKMLKERKEDNSSFNIISAGISALPGMSPTPEAIKVMSEQEIDISRHIATQVQEELVEKANLILVMSNTHKDYILRKFPFAQDKIYLLKEFAQIGEFKSKRKTDENYEVVDPLGRPIEFYRIIARELKENLEKILDKILEENNK